MAGFNKMPGGYWAGKTCSVEGCERPAVVKGKCRSHYSAANRRRTKSHLNYFLPKTYGITREQFDAMVQGQHGKCAVCGEKPRDGKRLFVDHCHRTNTPRGLLCHPCNIAAGSDETQIERLRDLIAYLEAFYATEYTGNTEAA